MIKKPPELIFKYREYNKYEVLPCFSFIYNKGIFIGLGVTKNRYWKDLPKYQVAFYINQNLFYIMLMVVKEKVY